MLDELIAALMQTASASATRERMRVAGELTEEELAAIRAFHEERSRKAERVAKRIKALYLQIEEEFQRWQDEESDRVLVPAKARLGLSESARVIVRGNVLVECIEIPEGEDGPQWRKVGIIPADMVREIAKLSRKAERVKRTADRRIERVASETQERLRALMIEAFGPIHERFGLSEYDDIRVNEETGEVAVYR